MYNLRGAYRVSEMVSDVYHACTYYERALYLGRFGSLGEETRFKEVTISSALRL